jgi:hypothetical protein
VRAGKTPGTANRIPVTPVAIIMSTTDVPRIIPARYHKLRRTPKTDAVAARLKVAGPGLPIRGKAVRSSRARFSTNEKLLG